MTEFYKELKSIRTEKGIELEKIHKRTKISLSALHAIEKGKFDQLPYTYVRLFIRAYAVEIGGDPEEVLDNLDIYLGNKTQPQKKDKDSAVKVEIEEKGTTNIEDVEVGDKVLTYNHDIDYEEYCEVKSTMVKENENVVTYLFDIY